MTENTKRKLESDQFMSPQKIFRDNESPIESSNTNLPINSKFGELEHNQDSNHTKVSNFSENLVITNGRGRPRKNH